MSRTELGSTSMEAQSALIRAEDEGQKVRIVDKVPTQRCGKIKASSISARAFWSEANS